ncbi:hypothetical protein QJS04_geneDACA024299 [Acorus gramineus]|uniref:Uncharacterized protein n=1 Tax=Acorus gramineus TaxID=55184 RepID=A0AAV9A3E0_ACOGR|nr:hypothetical protein QJS04_geneDACA024299 [Acorus gramineus]
MTHGLKELRKKDQLGKVVYNLVKGAKHSEVHSITERKRVDPVFVHWLFGSNRNMNFIKSNIRQQKRQAPTTEG